ncbi:hypothetical protein LSTR_LSTR007708 [Laodelphax striatellus]|uniref:Branched-chain-amino-acid aminotransferase n=1 Tax=Laodelphax striatellus TaxID=195883 RepID=A0A482WJ89_LAOST|nr:hypothetical protein LSTR_LSTR007708 [Laodelphax striatellus]
MVQYSGIARRLLSSTLIAEINGNFLSISTSTMTQSRHQSSSSLKLKDSFKPTLGIGASESALLYVILSPVASYFGPSFKPVSLMADPQFIRAWPGGCGDRKMGSNYAPTIHIGSIAQQKGFDQVLWLYGEDQQVTEAGTMNLFFLIINDDGEKELITPPLNGLILPGITRISIIQLMEQWNEIKVNQRKITMSEVCRLNSENRVLEMFGAGTAVVICPVDVIGYQDSCIELPTMRDQQSSLWFKLLTTLTGIQYGRVIHPWGRPIDE